jgi:hypothetical protein
MDSTNQMKYLNAKIQENTPLEGRGIKIERTVGGARINVKTLAKNTTVSNGAYDGPFKISKSGSNSVLVEGYNTEAGRYFRNYLVLGTQRLEVAETELSDIAADCWIYLNVQYSGAYSASIAKAEAMPAQSSGNYYVALGFVKISDSKISEITQVQFGTVEGAGRIF